MGDKFDFNQNIILRGNSVTLRPLTIEDYSGLLAVALTYKNLMQFSPSAINSPINLRGYIETALKQKENKFRYPFVIRENSSDLLIGSTSFVNVDDKNKKLEIGYTWLSPEYHGSGLNQKCKYLLLEYAFERCNMQRVEFKTDARNIQSRKAILKLGASFEAILRGHTVMVDGFRRDTVYYGILYQDWPVIKRYLSA